MRVVVECPQLKVIRACDEPLFSGDEVDTTNWDFRNLEGFNQSPGLVVIYVYGAIVKPSKNPRLSWMKINRLDSIGTRE
jgi:hypothetical protein